MRREKVKSRLALSTLLRGAQARKQSIPGRHPDGIVHNSVVPTGRVLAGACPLRSGGTQSDQRAHPNKKKLAQSIADLVTAGLGAKN
jgi:hypothetical protein